MNEVTKGKLLVQEIIARLKGDGAEALAAKISRKAVSAVEGQLAALNSKKVDLENSVEEAVETLNSAKFPTSVFSSNQSYVDAILRAQKGVDEAKAELESVNTAIKYFTDLLASF